jgi:hypothetical protein
MKYYHHYNLALHTYLDSEPGVTGTVADVAGRHHVNASAYARTVDGCNYWLWALKEPKRRIKAEYPNC